MMNSDIKKQICVPSIEWINSDKLKTKFPQIKQIKWDTIPIFSTLTGINGAGKSSLFKYIKEKLEFNYMILSQIIVDDDSQIIVDDDFQNISDDDSQIIVDEDSQNIVDDDSQIIVDVESKVILPLTLKLNDRVETLVDLSFFVRLFDDELQNKIISTKKSIFAFRDLEACLKLLENELEKLNKELLENQTQIKYKKIEFHENDNAYYLYTEDNFKVKILDLSPGEHLLLLLLLWQYIFDKYDVYGRTLLMFDEPDSHLHPTAVRGVLDILKKLSEKGVQIIMTTHNPTTVGLVDNKNLFLLKNENGNLDIQQVTSKHGVFKDLTDNYVYVSEPLKLVFTEGNGRLDNIFYKHIKHIYLNNFTANDNETTTPIVFRSMGACQFKQLFNKDLSTKESADVMKPPEILKYMHYGIIDGDLHIKVAFEYFYQIKILKEFVSLFDANKLQNNSTSNKKNELDKYEEHLLRLERYAIENYIHDPLNIFFSLKKLGNYENILELLNIQKYHSYIKDSMDTFLNRTDIDMHKKIDILNGIIKSITDKLIDFLIEILNSPNHSLHKEVRTSMENFQKTFGFKSGNDKKKDSIAKLSRSIRKRRKRRCLCAARKASITILAASKNMPGYKVTLLFKHNNLKSEAVVEYNPIMLFLKGKVVASVLNSRIIFEHNTDLKQCDVDDFIQKMFEHFQQIRKTLKFSELTDLNGVLKDLKQRKHELFKIDTYAHYKYIHEPLNIFFSMKKIKDNLKRNEITDLFKIPVDYRSYALISLKDFLNKKDILDQTKNTILNEIIKLINDKLIEFLKEIIDEPDNIDYHDIRKALTDFQTAFKFNDTLKNILEKSKNMEGYTVNLVYKNKQNTFELTYNPLLLLLRGNFAKILKSKIGFKVEADIINKLNGIKQLIDVKTNEIQDEIKLDWQLKEENGFILTKDLFHIMDYLSKDK